jgi:hypothetical protein
MRAHKWQRCFMFENKKKIKKSALYCQMKTNLIQD